MQFFKFRGNEWVKVVHKYYVIFYYTNIACYNEFMVINNDDNNIGSNSNSNSNSNKIY